MKRIKVVNISLIFIYSVIFVILVLIQIWSAVFKIDLSLSYLIYWMVLAGWMYLVYKWHLEDSVSFKFALFLFIIAASFALFGWLHIAEPIMRISFIGFLVGVGQDIIMEFKK